MVFGKFFIDQNPKITRFQSVARFGFEFSPKIANFGVFDRFLAKNAFELSGDAVPTEHQIHRKGVIFGLV